MTDFSIIIVNYNTKDLTKACIESVMNEGSRLDFEALPFNSHSLAGTKMAKVSKIGT